jgi:hypothetical protein
MFSQFPRNNLGASPVAFYISFDVANGGVVMPDYLREKFSRGMVIVLQNQYWDFMADHHEFRVTLWFSGKKENLRVPYNAIQTISSPEIGLQIRQVGREEPPDLGVSQSGKPLGP